MESRELVSFQGGDAVGGSDTSLQTSEKALDSGLVNESLSRTGLSKKPA